MTLVTTNATHVIRHADTAWCTARAERGKT